MITVIYCVRICSWYQQTRDVKSGLMFNGLTLTQHCFNISCFLGSLPGLTKSTIHHQKITRNNVSMANSWELITDEMTRIKCIRHADIFPTAKLDTARPSGQAYQEDNGVCCNNNKKHGLCSVRKYMCILRSLAKYILVQPFNRRCRIYSGFRFLLAH